MLLLNARTSDDTSARSALRSASDAAHQRMHGLEPFTKIASGTLPVDEYRRLLQSLYLFHSAVGEAADKGGWSRVSSAQRRLELLRSDLSALGGAVPVPVSGWDAGAGKAVLGSLYVAEGSMLGGRVVARQLDFLCGSQEDGRRFFVGDACDRANWSHLTKVLEDQCSQSPALSEAIDGACRTFDWFEQCIVAP